MFEANYELSVLTENEKRELMLSLEELAQIEGLRDYSASDSESRKYSELKIMMNSKAEKNDVIRHDGSVGLTNDWDVGNGFKIKINEIRARDSAGLKICDDEGNGIFIKDGGNVGIKTTDPLSELHIANGAFRIGNVIKHNVGQLHAGSGGGAKRFEIARIGYNKTSWRWTSSVIIELWHRYYDVGYKKYVVTAGYLDDGSFFLEEAHGSSSVRSNSRVAIDTEVLVSGNDYYLPVYVELDYYAYWQVVITHAMTETTDDIPSSGRIRIFENPSGSDISAFAESDIVEYKTPVKFNSHIEIDGNLDHDGSNLGFFGKTPTGQRLKASYNSWASVSDVVQALVDLGLFDQV